MKIWGIIPARFKSSRFPGKLLEKIENKPIISWVIENSLKAKKIDNLAVATDDERIYNIAKSYGIDVFMTPESLNSGTERIKYVIKNKNNIDGIVNIQGDEPLIDPDLIDELAESLKHYKISTAATFSSSEEEYYNPNIVKVVFDKNDNALYFSRSPIPYYRKTNFDGFWKHIGIYAYRRDILLQSNNRSSLEDKEKLEQLSFLENGISIKIIKTDYKGIGVDVKEDIEKIKALLKKG